MDKGGSGPANDNTLVGWLQSYLVTDFSVILFLTVFQELHRGDCFLKS